MNDAAVRGTGAAKPGPVTAGRPSGWTTARRVAAHASGVLCLGAVAVLALQGPGGTADAIPPRVVEVAPGATTLVCPSPARLVQQDVGDDEFDATPVETVSDLGVAGAAPDVTGLDGTMPGADLARVIRAEPGELAAATTTSVTTAGDLRGLVAGACRAPAVEHWLAGGSTDVGSSSRLVLQNPGRTAASVSLSVWGPAGPVTLGSRSVVVVPPGEQREATLEAIAPEQARVVVHAVSQGARIHAYLQHHRIDGLVPQGADLVAAGTAPAPELAVAGIVSNGGSMENPHSPSLRLLAPGDDDGTARVSIYGADGQEWLRGVENVALQAGSVTDVPLGGLPEGGYAVVVDATVPVVGAGLNHLRGDEPPDTVIDGFAYDTAWIPAQPLGPPALPGRTPDGPSSGTTGRPGLLALPGDTSWSLDVAAIPEDRSGDTPAAGSADVTITGYAADGSETGTVGLTVPAGQAEELPGTDLEALGEEVAAVAVTSADGARVVWSLRLAADDDTLIATLTPPATGTSATRTRIQATIAGR